MFPEEENELRPYIFNSCAHKSYAGKKEQQMENFKEPKGEGRSHDWSKTSEGIENYVNFPNFTPIEIIELYRKLDLQRIKFEKKRIYTQDELLKKEEREIFINDNHK